MQYKKGLRGYIAGQTSICELNEKTKRITYRGRDIETLAGKVPFEEVAYLLLGSRHASWFELNEFKIRVCTSFCSFGLGKWEKVAETLAALPPEAHSMELLRHIINAFAMYDDRRKPQDEAHDREIAIDLVGLMIYFVALVQRHKEGLSPLLIIPSDKGSLAANIFYLLGKKPSPLEVEVMDVLFTLYAEHEFNGSTFGGVRMAAPLDTDIYSGMINGVGNLKGLRHGGANEATWGLIQSFADVVDVEDYLLKKIGETLEQKAGWKMPGFGHAVYKTGDARVPIIKDYIYRLSREKKNMIYFDICCKIEQAMLKAHRLYPLKKYPSFRWWFPNIDFWAAPVYYLMGIPHYLNTPLFAASRIAGWAAHWIECKYELKEKLIRPRAMYIGPKPQT